MVEFDTKYMYFIGLGSKLLLKCNQKRKKKKKKVLKCNPKFYRKKNDDNDDDDDVDIDNDTLKNTVMI